MSTKIGTVQTSSKAPIMYSGGAPVSAHVYVSGAGVELVTLPCMMSAKQAEELAALLSRAAKVWREETSDGA